MIPMLKPCCISLLTLSLAISQTQAQNFDVSTDEASRLAIQMDTSMNHGNPEILNHLVDFSFFASTLQSKINIPPDSLFRVGLWNEISLFSLGSNTLPALKNGSYRLLRNYAVNGQRHLLFRSFGEDGVNYQDFLLVKIKDSIKAADVHSYADGESMSTMAKTIIESRQLNTSRGSIGEGDRYLMQFNKAMKDKNYAAARSAFHKLDLPRQQDIHLQTTYLMASKRGDRKAFKKALEDYTDLFPGEITGYVLLSTVYTESKENGLCLDAVNKLDSLVGGDPFLNYLKGNLTLKMGDLGESKEFYLKAFDYDPLVWQNTKQLVSVQVVNNELVQANAVIAEYRRTPGFKQELVDELYENYPVLK